MKVLIEEYRGWEIQFDTEKEEFYCLSNEYDSDKTKKSYASAKKYIDDYIKENEVFKPIKIVSRWGRNELVTIIGKRKDNAFIIQKENGTKEQLSKYDETDAYLYNSDNDKYYDELDEIDKQMESLREKRVAINSKIIRVTVKDYRRKLEP